MTGRQGAPGGTRPGHPLRLLTQAGVGGVVTRRLVATCGAVLTLVLVLVLFVVAHRTGTVAPTAGLVGVCLALLGLLSWVVARTAVELQRAGIDHHRLVDELTAERDFSRTVVGSLHDGVVVGAADGSILHVSERWSDITGYPADTVGGLRPPFPWWPEDQVAAWTAGLGPILADGLDVDANIDLRRPDGTLVNVRYTMRPVRNPDGSVRMNVGTVQDLTSANRTEADRRRAARQLDHFFYLSGDLMCIADGNGRLTRVNPAFGRTLGYSEDDLLARPYIDFVHTDDVERTASEERALSDGTRRTVEFENRYRCRDGSYRWLSWNAAPVPEHGLIYAVARDITGVRRADEVRSWFAAIVDSTEDAVIGKSLDGTIVSWNAAAERMYGYTAAEAIGRPIDMLSPEGHLADVAADLARVSRGEPIPHHEIRRRHKSGRLVPVGVSISPVRDSGGTVIGMASIATDVTAQKIAEERFRRLVFAAPDAIVIVDTDGVIVVSNQQTERMFGYPSAELVGLPIETLVPERLRHQHVGHRRGYLGQPTIHGMGIGMALYGLRRDSSEFPVEVSLTPLDVEVGPLVAASIRDVSERKRAERDLAQARDEAVAAAQVKSQFVATVSHEIRTPMNGVLGLTRLLLDTPLEPSQRRFADGIEASGRALLTIINDILDFSKIESGKLELAPAPFQLGSLLDEVVSVAAELARDKDIEVVAYYPPTLPRLVVGDAGRLRQVLLNLIGNAVKFTDHGEVRLTAVPSTGDAITVAVADTGIGIDSAQVDHLFEPFSQVDAATDRRFGGTGLGLAICRSIIEAMRGELAVESRPGHGSRFFFTVTLPPDTSRPTDELSALLVGRRVLIADDNVTSLRLMNEHAQAWGMVPTTASDGTSALRHLRAAAATGGPFEVAILDQHMPGTDGLEVANTVASDPALPPVRIVVLTSGSYLADQVALQAGAVEVLPKPAGPSQLFNCMLRLLGAGPGVEPAHHAADRLADRGLVLVAEDNRINQLVATATLASLGYRAEIAHDGHEAVALATSGRFQAILMDCQMPGMDGFAATAEVRRREGGDRHTPIIAITAGALAEDRERCTAAGMDGFVPKPIDPDLLRAVLETWTAERTSPADDRRRALRSDVERRLALLRNNQPPADGDLAGRLVAALVADLPEYLGRLDTAQAAGRADQLAVVAHDLAGAVGNVGATDLADLARRLQHTDADDAPALLSLVRAETGVLRDVLRSLPTVDRAGAALPDR